MGTAKLEKAIPEPGVLVNFLAHSLEKKIAMNLELNNIRRYFFDKYQDLSVQEDYPSGVSCVFVEGRVMWSSRVRIVR